MWAFFPWGRCLKSFIIQWAKLTYGRFRTIFNIQDLRPVDFNINPFNIEYIEAFIQIFVLLVKKLFEFSCCPIIIRVFFVYDLDSYP